MGHAGSGENGQGVEIVEGGRRSRRERKMKEQLMRSSNPAFPKDMRS